MANAASGKSPYADRPIINCHTHIFTGDHVPPFLAKTFLPAPFYRLVRVGMLVKWFRFYFRKIDPFFHQPTYRKIRQVIYNIRMWIQRRGIVSALLFLIGVALTISTYVIVMGWLRSLRLIDLETKQKWADPVENFFLSYGIDIIPESTGLKILIVLLLVVFFKTGRNAILFVLKRVASFLKALPGPKSKELAQRYLNIGRYAFHETQRGTWEQLLQQYPPGSAFIILPMDMEYMDAGKLKSTHEYRFQMNELKNLKQSKDGQFMFPFVFAEPRRIAEENKNYPTGILPDKTKVQFRYSVNNGKFSVEDCFIRDYIEEHHFAGFKIYPALGYYPFDEELLPLWKYAADNFLPILTHCIRGNIYYRGQKKKVWDEHPIFKQASGDGNYDQHLALMETKNIDYINNFTHPLNYLCLLDETLLRIKVGQCTQKVKDVFGYNGPNQAMTHNLSNLKICFGHFGGDDEWDRFMELDRDLYSRELVQNPTQGVLFLKNKKGEPTPGKPEQTWKNLDWYSIVCSLMLQYDNVYADLSYILHNDDIHPLLKQTLQNKRLRDRTLFGTDFYVVRNHKSEKGLLASIIDHLSEDDFDQIAKINPRQYLANRIHGAVTI